MPPTKRNTKPRATRTRAKSTTVLVRGRGDYTMPDAEFKLYQELKSEVAALRKRAEKSDSFKSATRSGGRALGATLGALTPFGSTLGASAGEAAGGMLARLFGHGDFKLRGNSLMQGLPESQSMVPVFGEKGKRGIRVMEREYIGDITAAGALANGATAFSVNSFAINPQNPKLFPWLSKFAALFDQWEPNGIIFEYVSTSSEFNGTSQALGAVICATDYNSLDPGYTSKQQMEEADYANSVKSSECLMHGIECAPSERVTKLLLTGPVEPNDAQNLYNLGNFQVATQGMSVSGVTVGELWVSYDITFYKKQINAPGSQVAYSTMSSTPAATTNIFGAVNPLSVRGTLPVVFANNLITLPSYIINGNYAVFIYMVAASGSPSASVGTLTNCVAAGGNYPLNVAVSNTTSLLAQATVTVTGPSATIAITCSSIGVTPLIYCQVTQMPSSLPYTNNLGA